MNAQVDHHPLLEHYLFRSDVVPIEPCGFARWVETNEANIHPVPVLQDETQLVDGELEFLLREVIGGGIEVVELFLAPLD
mgnify:CR=1 FL=1